MSAAPHPADPETQKAPESVTAAELAALVAHAANAAGANYFASKLIQPDWRQITLNGAAGVYVVEDDWTGPWTPQSVMVSNPHNFTIWLAANGDPRNSGFAFPANTTLRVPISGQQGGYVVGVNAADLGAASITVSLFRFATPD